MTFVAPSHRGATAQLVRPSAGEPGHLTRRARRERERRARLRRTVLVGLAALLTATTVARIAQDPSVAVPRAPDATAALGQAVLVAPAPQASPEVPSLSPASPAPTAATSFPPGQVEAGADPAPTAQGSQPAVQQSARGTLRVLPVPPGVPARTSGRLVRYSVEVEDGIAADGEDFARIVSATLDDARGWRAVAGVSFVPVSSEQAASGAAVDVRVTLATPQLTARLCAPLDTESSQVSCWNGGRSVVNLQRWLTGSATYGTDLARYRAYVVNHEVGHGLGLAHQHCPAAGQPAPVMVQQTKSLEGCTAWPWPTPP